MASTSDLLSLVSAVTDGEPPNYDYTRINDFGPDVLPREWRGLVLDDPEDRKAFNRRQLEVVALLELAAAIKAGEIFVTGSLSTADSGTGSPPKQRTKRRSLHMLTHAGGKVAPMGS